MIVADNFNFEQYKKLSLNLLSAIPCILCNRFHILHIHQNFERLIRSNQTGENEPIYIFSIICLDAKVKGQQYTKRILPSFVISECNITLENAINMYQEFPDGKLNLDRASQILGTVCDDTIRKHYRLIQEMAETTNLELLTHLSHLPSFANLPLCQDLPDENTLGLLNKYIWLYTDALVRMGKPVAEITVNIFLFRTYYLKKARKNIIIPMDFISQYHFFLNY